MNDLNKKRASVVDGETKAGRGSRPVLREAAYHSFMDYLLSGQLKPGLLVSQRELCEVTGATLGSMREALKRLEAEGIVNLIPQRGVMVREPGEKEINDVYGVRQIFEPYAAKYYAEHGDLGLIAKIKTRTKGLIDLKADTREELDNLSRERIVVDDILHQTLLGELNNLALDEIFEKIRVQIQVNRVGVQPRFMNTKPAVAEHLKIIEAVESRDGDAAAAAMSEHLEKSHRRAIGLD